MELAARELQVRWLWQDQLLAVSQVAHGVLRIGPGTDCDVLPEAKAPFELARWADEGWTVRVPAGTRAEVDDGHGAQSLGQPRLASELLLGECERATLDFGQVRAELSWADRPRRAGLGFRDLLDLRFLYFLVTTAFTFGIVILSGSLARTDDDELESTLVRFTPHQRVSLVARPVPPPVMSATTPAEPVKVAPAASAPVASKTSARGSGHHGKATTTQQLVQSMLGSSVLAGMIGNDGFGPGLSDALAGMGRGRNGVASGIDGLDLRGGPPSDGPGQSIRIGALSTHHGPDYGPGGGLCQGLHCKDSLGPKIDPGPEVHIVGSLDRDLIRAVIHRNRAQIRYCYEQSLIGAPQLSGRAEVHFVIGAEGNVLHAEIASSTTHAPTLDACLASRFQSWIFPKPKGGGVVEVTYPVVLQRGGTVAGE